LRGSAAAASRHVLRIAFLPAIILNSIISVVVSHRSIPCNGVHCAPRFERSITRLEIMESVIYTAEGDKYSSNGKTRFLAEIELIDASSKSRSKMAMG
jgi:hypothetical protein